MPANKTKRGKPAAKIEIIENMPKTANLNETFVKNDVVSNNRDIEKENIEIKNGNEESSPELLNDESDTSNSEDVPVISTKKKRGTIAKKKKVQLEPEDEKNASPPIQAKENKTKLVNTKINEEPPAKRGRKKTVIIEKETKKNRRGKQEIEENDIEEQKKSAEEVLELKESDQPTVDIETEKKTKRAKGGKRAFKATPAPPSNRPTRSKKIEVIYERDEDNVSEDDKKPVAKKAKKTVTEKKRVGRGKKEKKENDEGDSEKRKNIGRQKGKGASKKMVQKDPSDETISENSGDGEAKVDSN